MRYNLLSIKRFYYFGSPDKSVGLGIKFSESEKKEPNIRHSS